MYLYNLYFSLFLGILSHPILFSDMSSFLFLSCSTKEWLYFTCWKFNSMKKYSSKRLIFEIFAFCFWKFFTYPFVHWRISSFLLFSIARNIKSMSQVCFKDCVVFPCCLRVLPFVSLSLGRRLSTNNFQWKLNNKISFRQLKKKAFAFRYNVWKKEIRERKFDGSVQCPWKFTWNSTDISNVSIL